jgi:hypothetical protein
MSWASRTSGCTPGYSLAPLRGLGFHEDVGLPGPWIAPTAIHLVRRWGMEVGSRRERVGVISYRIVVQSWVPSLPAGGRAKGDSEAR